MNRKGFTLLEILIIVVVLIVIFLLSIPIVRTIISNSRFGSFENSVYSAIDAVDVYIVNHEWTAIPNEGLEISVLDDSILRNNNFDEGVFVRENGQVRMLYIKQGEYCAKGTKDKLITTDKGCGALDETEPTKANLFLKNSDDEAIYIVASGEDSESKIIKYELSIDGDKYYTNDNDMNNVFRVKLADNKEHTFKVRVINEAGLTKESSTKQFKKGNNHIIIYETDNLENVQKKKSFGFTKLDKAIYSYSTDLENWTKFNEEIISNNNEVIYIKETINNKDNYYTLNVNNIDNILNGAYPELDEKMIPVTYDGNNWIVANKNQRYWDYENGIYANIVLVRKNKDINDDNSHERDYYLTNEAIGSVVYEKDIIAFYVWIPRFKYQIWNIGGTNPLESVNLVFENKEIPLSNGNNNDDWLTHPAFNYILENGFWVSKYAASVAKDLNCYLIPNEVNCNNDIYDLYSLPDRNALDYISISNASTLSQNLNKQFNVYGLTNEVVPHLMTNLEWGAVTYLLSSKYKSDNITGIQSIGTIAEYVMGNFNKDAGYDKKLNSGFEPDGKNKWPNIYIDIYKSISLKGYKLGDATMEVNNLSDNNTFVNGENPFIIRGLNSIYAFNNTTGAPKENVTFRPVISKVKIEE